jgi:AcrR family transcriptional regulator
VTRPRKDRRAQLTQAAFEVFTDRGYRNCSVADIATAAGLSAASFYNYFTNKRDILDAAIDFGFEQFGPQLSPPTELADSLDEFLDAITSPLRELYSLSVANSKLISLMAFDAPAIDDAVAQRVGKVFNSFARSTQRQIEHGVEMGYLRPDIDSQVLGEMLVAISLTVLLPTQGGAPLPGGVDHFIEQVADFLRAGLGNRAGSTHSE